MRKTEVFPRATNSNIDDLGYNLEVINAQTRARIYKISARHHFGILFDPLPA